MTLSRRKIISMDKPNATTVSAITTGQKMSGGMMFPPKNGVPEPTWGLWDTADTFALASL